MHLGTRFSLRWFGGALARLSGSGAARYRPSFSEAAVRNALSAQAHASGGMERRSDAPTGANPHPHGSALHAARLARERIGSRFFVSPDAIPALWRRLEQEHPDWFRTQVERTNADATDGIPLYDGTGPRLGSGFPWADLARQTCPDPLYPLRPHRFAFAPRNALACLYDPGAAARLRGTLTAWMSAARSGDRYCYASNLAVIQRILALSWCWAFLAARPLEPGEDGAELELLVLTIIMADIGFLEPRYGRSMRNNHLLADRFAAWYLRVVFPEFLRRHAESDKEANWKEELLAQTYADGGSFEHSAHYHEFACEMGAAYLLLCRRNRFTADAELARRVEALLRFQLALSGPGCTPLPLGNGTEDTLFPLDSGEGWCPGSLRELYRALFRADVAPAPAGDDSAIRAYWLLAGELAPRPQGAFADECPHTLAFPHSGFYLQADHQQGARLGFRTGPPPGVPVTAGHMHADLLSVYLSIGDRPLLVDAGTYTYRRGPGQADAPAPAWRAYFAGPAAHNGLAIHGRDPLGDLDQDFRAAEPAARVIATRHADGRLELLEARLLAAAPYDGVRRTCLHLRGAYWLLLDDPAGAAQAWYGFQCAPEARVALDGHRATITPSTGGSSLILLGTPRLDAPQVLDGSQTPLGGWVSVGYGRLSPAPQIRFGVAADGTPSAFLLAVGGNDVGEPVLECSPLQAGATLTRVRRGDTEDLFVHDARPAGGGPTRYADLCFEGRLLWVRLRAGRPVALQWLDGRHFTWRTHALEIERAARCDLVLDEFPHA